VRLRIAILLLATICSVLAAQERQLDSGNAANAAVPQGTGRIQGKAVAFSSGQPLANVTVTAQRMDPLPIVTQAVAAAYDGSFAIDALPPGRYAVCASDKTGQYASSCTWKDSQIKVNVSNETVAGPLTLKAKAVATLQIRVNDSGNVLRTMPKDLFPPHVLIGVWDFQGSFHPAAETKDARGISYQIQIPADTALRLEVLSKSVRLQRPDGTPIPASGISQSFMHHSKEADQTSFTFNAVGRNP